MNQTSFGHSMAFMPVLAAVMARGPRIHCLTNGVAQAMTAHALVAIGAEPTMTAHPAEVFELARQSDALLVNLGMLDAEREAAILAMAQSLPTLACPVVLDPVMIHRSLFRVGLAKRFFDCPSLIVKGNSSEMAFLETQVPASATRVTTGEIDHVVAGGVNVSIRGGSPLMARFSGSGCLAGGVIAAFAAVEPDLAKASAAALALLRHAAEEAAPRAPGPGTFLPHFLDCLAEAADEAQKSPVELGIYL